MIDRLLKRVFLFFGILLILFCGFITMKLLAQPFEIKRFLFFFIIPLALGLTFVFASQRSVEFRVTVITTLTAFVTAIYGAEIYLIISHEPVEKFLTYHKQEGLKAAKKYGRNYDARSKMEVIEALRASGKKAYPSLIPLALLKDFSKKDQTLVSPLKDQGQEILPLGGIANHITVHCNEMGHWFTAKSDKHGFINPEGQWEMLPIQVAIVGDSYTHACVKSDENYASRIRNKFPSTLNLGVAGTGPLSYLARIREYLTTLKPQIVIWSHYEGNDVTDLLHERRTRILQRYLDPEFRQGLVKRQNKIDVSLSAWFDDQIKKKTEGIEADITPINWHDVVLLRTLRDRLKIGLTVKFLSKEAKHTAQHAAEYNYDLKLFEQIIREAIETIESWGGKLVFVYIPSFSQFCNDVQRWKKEYCYSGLIPYKPFDIAHKPRNQILKIVNNNNVPVVDMLPIFKETGAAEQLYVFPGAHLTPAGYRLVGDTILDTLNKIRGIP